MTLTAHHIQVRATATGPLELHTHTGSALRGGFFHALWSRFCTNHGAPTCRVCPLVQACPVSSLVAPLRDEHPRGRDVPRPFAVRPPLHHAGAFGPGDQFTWGLTLIGQPISLFPYVAMALHVMGDHGVGKRVAENNWERGRFVVEAVDAVNLLTSNVQTIQHAGSQRIHVPSIPMTMQDAATRAATLDPTTVTLHFRTPLRLIEHKQLLKRPLMRPLIQRLIERYDALARGYSADHGFSHAQRTQLTDLADTIALTVNHTRWIDLDSYSNRQQRKTPIGGLIGRATYTGDLAPLLPLLVWGSVVQAGKDTTKGNGVFTIGQRT